MKLIQAFFSVFFVFGIVYFGNPNHSLAQDSLRFSYLDFMEQVVSFHPVVKQANLLTQTAKAKLQKARGGFDPKIHSNLNQKYYQDKNYFRIIQNQLKVPTRLGGIEFQGGYDYAEGNYLNPENKVPKKGLTYAGVSVPLGQGFLIDRRRADLQQAKIFTKQIKAEQKILINSILREAGHFYQDWLEAYYQQKIAQEAVDLAQIRMDGIREGFLVGNNAAIDTTEALIQLQTRRLSQIEAQNKFQNSTQKLSVFLWDKSGLPLTFETMPMPDSLETFQYENLISIADLDGILENLNAHPKILKYKYKIEKLQVERRFKADKLKPKLKVKYNYLLPEKGKETEIAPTTNNFKWGFQLDYPLFLRSERGGLNEAKVKISSSEYELQYERQLLITKLQNYQNKLQGLAQQIALYENTVQNYNRLVDGENEKFRVGESYLFLVNKREMKRVEAQLKLLSLKVKFQKSLLNFYEASGEIPILTKIE